MRCLKCGANTPNGNFCRHCGAPLPKKKPIHKRKWFWPAVVFVAIMFVAAIFGEWEEPQAPASATPALTAEPTLPAKTAPLASPTQEPTLKPSIAPTLMPTPTPTPKLTQAPIVEPTQAPTQEPTLPSTPESTETAEREIPYKENYHGHVYTGGESSKRYHYEAGCAGKYSHEITWDEVEQRGLGPCGTCVLK